jgi:hypothetical protein
MEKKSVGLLELETGVLECFLEKTPLSPLGVKVDEIVFFPCINGGHQSFGGQKYNFFK